MTTFDPEADEVSLHDAAVIYRAGRWRRAEAQTLDAFATGADGLALARAAALFKVARVFPGDKGDEAKRAARFAQMVPMLKRATDGLTPDNLVSRVQQLSKDMMVAGDLVRTSKGGRFSTISPCSKFVWCTIPEVGIIYDERAREALSRLQHPIGRSDYAKYVESFREELRQRDSELDAVLPLLGSLADRPWMKSKLLDFWLYTNGRLVTDKAV